MEKLCIRKVWHSYKITSFLLEKFMQGAASDSIMNGTKLYDNICLPELTSRMNKTLQIVIASYTIRHRYQQLPFYTPSVGHSDWPL